jgi:rSAM/selenodomain-associated transferase 1
MSISVCNNYKYKDYRLLLFAREPKPGDVKTRLHETLGKDRSYDLYCALFRYQAARLTRCGLAPCDLWVTSNREHPLFTEFFLPDGIYLQSGGDLGARMHHAANVALAGSAGVLLVGADCPSVDAPYLEQALASLDRGVDVVVGPAEDGGYVLLGLRESHSELFREIPWGTNRVMELTRARLVELRLEWEELESRWDVDRQEDLARLAAMSPDFNY